MPSPGAPAAPACLRVVENDRIVWTIGDDGAGASTTQSTTSASTFVKARTAGAYTTARTFCRTRVFDLERHVGRLAESAALLGGASGGGAAVLPTPPPALSDAGLLRPRVLSLLRLGLFGDADPRGRTEADPALGTGEFRVTILATWGSEEEREATDDGSPPSSFSLSLHVAPLPPPPTQPVVALIAGEGRRRRASAKSSSWVSDRSRLEAEGREAGAEEVLLVETEREGEGEGRRLVFEGLSSNFAAVREREDEGEEAGDETLYGRGYELQTAPDETVLSGTVRALLLEVVAPRAGFSVPLSPPCVEDAASGKWVGALLLSTSRLALPVAELREKEDEGKEGERSSATRLVARFFEKGGSPHPVVARLSRDVAAALEGASESLLEQGRSGAGL